MISQKEIKTIAAHARVPASTIEKDWALSHVISALYADPEFRKSWLFKGGTCLRKCYIPGYRFSEDLDFTATGPESRITRKFLDWLQQYLAEQCQMLTHLESYRNLTFENIHTGYEVVLKFWGPDHPASAPPPAPSRWTTSVRMEFILFEKVIFPSNEMPILHEYSDYYQITGSSIPSYSLEEILAEKLRALIQRRYSAPRDFYDIWKLHHHFGDLDWKEITQAFYEKVAYKNLTFEGPHQLLSDRTREVLLKNWEATLKHQLHPDEYPDAKLVLKDCEGLFGNLFR